MRQYAIIKEINRVLPTIEGIQAALLIGSGARKAMHAKSDVDYLIIVNQEFSIETLIQKITQLFSNMPQYHTLSFSKKKILFFLDHDFIRVEFMWYEDFSEIEPLFLGSEIQDPKDSIVFDHTGKLQGYLNQLLIQNQNNMNETLQNEAFNLIARFIDYFESASMAHSRNDFHKFFILHTKVLSILARIIYLAQGYTRFRYMPPYFSFPHTEYKTLVPTHWGAVNVAKRTVLNLFYEYVTELLNKLNINFDLDTLKQFLETIYARDFFYNLRDISQFNPKIKKGFIFRSGLPVFFIECQEFFDFLRDNNIKTIIDLRAEREIEEYPYNRAFLNHYEYVHAPFDPWNQPERFQRQHSRLSDPMEITYLLFLKEYKESTCKVIRKIITAKNSVLIHCTAGKDRTGIVVTLLHLLSGASVETAKLDFLTNQSSAKEKYFDLIIAEINRYGGVEGYLQSCHLSKEEIQQLKNKIVR